MDILITQEQQDDIRDFLIEMIKTDKWRSASKIVNGDANLVKILGFNTPIEFLNLYSDLEVVKSTTRPEILLFRYEPTKNLMEWNTWSSDREIYVEQYGIWNVLKDVWNLDFMDTRELISAWIEETFGYVDTKPRPIVLSRTEGRI